VCGSPSPSLEGHYGKAKVIYGEVSEESYQLYLSHKVSKERSQRQFSKIVIRENLQRWFSKMVITEGSQKQSPRREISKIFHKDRS
jgi:hypothetical protein